MSEENMMPETQLEKKTNGAGCLGELGWFFSGAILPLGSLAYYRKAAQKSVGSAILFFIVFTLVISTLTTISAGIAMISVVNGIQQAYTDGEIPEITISQGIAEVDSPQPFVLVNDRGVNGERILVATDTSGEITEIDTSQYDQGFLLTRTELHILNQQRSDYQVVPLTELHTLFGKDPIIVNSQTVSQAWGVFSVIAVIFVFIFLVLWHTVVRLMIISLLALIAWGIVSLIKPKTGFGPILITGLYAVIPAIYLSHLLSRSGLSFPGLQTFFLVIFWVLGLIVTLADLKFFGDERPLRLWTALIGLPMLLIFVVDMFWQFPAPAGLIVLWVITLLTMLVLIGLRLFFRFRDQKPAQALNENPPPGSTGDSDSGLP